MAKRQKQTNNNNEYRGRSLWEEAWRRFKKNKLALICMCFILSLVFISVGTVIIDAVTDNQFYDDHVIKQDLLKKLEPPSKEHIFGLDEFGRDIALRVLWGTRYSLFLGTFPSWVPC